MKRVKIFLEEQSIPSRGQDRLFAEPPRCVRNSVFNGFPCIPLQLLFPLQRYEFLFIHQTLLPIFFKHFSKFFSSIFQRKSLFPFPMSLRVFSVFRGKTSTTENTENTEKIPCPSVSFRGKTSTTENTENTGKNRVPPCPSVEKYQPRNTPNTLKKFRFPPCPSVEKHQPRNTPKTQITSVSLRGKTTTTENTENTEKFRKKNRGSFI